MACMYIYVYMRHNQYTSPWLRPSPTATCGLYLVANIEHHHRKKRDWEGESKGSHYDCISLWGRV